jgi:cytochrome c biogenesis protein CcmG/thiol:disulfide interchange protein DsbE
MVTVSAGFAASSNLVSPRPRLSYNEVERSIPLKRNTIVLTVVLFILAVFAWAGWANWEYRKQAAERALASTAQGELAPGLVTEGAGGMPQYVSPLKGKPAPAFALEDLSGKKVSLASYKGKAVLINFWATWCGPCKIETPWLVELRNQYAAQGFEVLGVSTEADDLQQDDKAGWAKDKAAIAKFVQEEQMPYPVLLDGDSISKPYGGLDDLPTSFFVDRNGTVVATQLGLTSKDDIEANIKKALGK